MIRTEKMYENEISLFGIFERHDVITYADVAGKWKYTRNIHICKVIACKDDFFYHMGTIDK